MKVRTGQAITTVRGDYDPLQQIPLPPLELRDGEGAERDEGVLVKITKLGFPDGPNNKILKGSCNQCGCEVEVELWEASVLVDRDSPNGARYVDCPTKGCDCQYLWVK